MTTSLDTAHQIDNANLAMKVKDVDLAGALSVAGNAAVTGTLTVTGATTLTGAVTQKSPVISGSGATVTLTAAQSGNIVLFDKADGIVFTLPAPAVGLHYTFIVKTTITSNAAKVITDAGTTLLIGTLLTDNAGTAAGWAGNGTTHIAVSMNGTTTGGIQGTRITFECVSSTLWEVNGIVQASGTTATPFSAT